MTPPNAETVEAFAANVIRTLEKSGYPGKRVSLPLERMYEVAHGKGLNFNKVLDLLAAQGIAHEKTTTKIVFFPAEAGATSPAPPSGDLASMLAQARELMKTMTPEQLQEIQNMVTSMSDDEKASMLERAKDLGLKP
jgi:hypothetical protein